MGGLVALGEDRPADPPPFQRAASGPGAVQAWQGNSDIGEGRIEILQADAPRRLLLKPDFLKPFAARNGVESLLEAQGGGTWLAQPLFGPGPFVSKLMDLMFDMDTMVSGKHEEGLASPKLLAER